MTLKFSHTFLSENETSIVITSFLLWLTYIYLFSSYNYPLVYEFLILLNSLISIWNLVSIRKEPYSLRMMVNLFIYIFFILANAIQFGSNNNLLTYSYDLTVADFCFFQVLNFIILIIFNSVYSITLSKTIIDDRPIFLSDKKAIQLSLIFTFVVFFFFKFNLFALLARGFVSDMLEGSRTSIDTSESWAGFLIFDHFIRPIPWAIFIICLIFKQFGSKTKFILFLCALLTVFPTGMARNAAAMYWIPIFILLFRNKIKGRSFVWIMFVGLFFVFPFLDNFRRFNGTFDFKGGLDYLNDQGFDASQMFMGVISKNIITYGHQLLGVFLFFVPRSIWPSKPIGSGGFVAIQNNAWFSNVSMPFFGEGYINFGFIGLLLFTVLLGYGCKKMDTCYWTSKNYGKLFQGYYLIILSSIIFILRGDLMSSFAYTSGLIFCYFIVSKIIIKKPSKVLKK